ncbi:MAG: hypothetical protein ACOX9C_04400 [Kiritimatiellia bacterium]|jgi:phage gpG-like protein
MSVSFEFSGGEEFNRALRALGSDAAMRAVAMEAAEELKIMTELSFNSASMRPAEWLPLSGATEAGLSKARKRAAKKRGAAKPLIDTGTLMKSFSIEDAGPDGATLASDTAANKGRQYAAYHQHGTKKMPARPFVPAVGGYNEVAKPTDKARRRLETAMKRALAAAARRAGLDVET